MTTEKSIKLKNGQTLPAGLPVTFDQKKPHVALVHGDRPEPYRVQPAAAFTKPTIEELEEMVCDGQCLSVAGNTTEPDGWCHEGSPSWLMALGMI